VLRRELQAGEEGQQGHKLLEGGQHAP
jgi:hypothetical protein